MGRPSKPLLDRERITTTALELVDEQGRLQRPADRPGGSGCRRDPVSPCGRPGRDRGAAARAGCRRDRPRDAHRRRAAVGPRRSRTGPAPTGPPSPPTPRRSRCSRRHPCGPSGSSTSTSSRPGSCSTPGSPCGRDAGDHRPGERRPGLRPGHGGAGGDVGTGRRAATPLLAAALAAMGAGRADAAFELALTGFLAHVSAMAG